jgi:hypothetical protein
MKLLRMPQRSLLRSIVAVSALLASALPAPGTRSVHLWPWLSPQTRSPLHCSVGWRKALMLSAPDDSSGWSLTPPSHMT